MDRNRSPRGLAAHYALPAGFTALLVVGAFAAGLGGRLPATGVLTLAAAVVLAISAVSEPLAAPVLGVIGWLTVAGFSHPPYAQLRMTGPVAARAALTMAVCVLAGAGIGLMVRGLAPSFRLGIVRVHGGRPGGRDAGRPGVTGPPGETMRTGLRGRRQVAGILLVAGLPLLTVVLAALRPHLDLANDLLIYLVAVVAVAVVGGFWPAVLAAITASLLLNWYFTVPLHTLTIAEPRNILALLLFVTVAVTVSSVVHLAARRQVQAARSAGEAASLLELAQTVLGGADTPTAVLDHLTSAWGGRAELAERVRDQWVSVAVSGSAPPAEVATRVPVNDTVALLVAGQSRPITARLLDGFAAQAGAALDRDRLRTQAAQAEALAEGNRMRTALLAAVSHDLRTPLASIKASVSTLRQTDVDWTAADEAALLATIEDGADRLDALIGNLLDMSRLATGSLQPFLRATSVEEVAPAALLGLAPASSVRIAVPDGLPLVRTDPVLLERVLANLFSNALAHSPSGQPPELRATPDGGSVRLEVCDHGPGVPDEFKLRMFEPFERLGDRATGNGVGLGLAVAKGFLEAMGGTIHAADTPGGGLTVQVSLPAAAATADSAAPPVQ
ncbi:MAG: periplasmic sensor signal transduction histidine kinase [Actinomycetia bacterium]|nr:periplasmic sensor signal transduction histidine kinase [Actinomycetes bacterium]